jgi:hypothetical protein
VSLLAALAAVLSFFRQASSPTAPTPASHSRIKNDAFLNPPRQLRPQIQDYNFNKPGYSQPTAHATQLLWRDTTRVGCALNAACDLKTFICHYTPPGNIMGGRGYPGNWALQVRGWSEGLSHRGCLGGAELQ